MTEINQSELNSTLLRIKNSLNKRYEKDAEMYISYQDALKIRHHIFEKEFEAIADIINSGIMSKPALSRVVVKNLWLINEVDAVTARQINSIISFCDFSAIVQHSIIRLILSKANVAIFYRQSLCIKMGKSR